MTALTDPMITDGTTTIANTNTRMIKNMTTSDALGLSLLVQRLNALTGPIEDTVLFVEAFIADVPVSARLAEFLRAVGLRYNVTRPTWRKGMLLHAINGRLTNP